MEYYSPIEGVEVYDDVFSLAQRYRILEHVKDSPYVIGWADTRENAENYMYSLWQPTLLNKINFFGVFTEDHPLHEKLDPKKFLRCVVNSDVCTNTHWTHTHEGENVLLYYVNMDWSEHWGGETLFFDKNRNNDVTFGSRYVPNRVIWFDGEIPHTIKSQSRLGPKYRFTISVFFSK